jgi:hypothetical protein
LALTQTNPPPRPASRPMKEVVKNFISKSKPTNTPPPVPPKLKKLQLLLKQLNIQKSNKND